MSSCRSWTSASLVNVGHVELEVELSTEAREVQTAEVFHPKSLGLRLNSGNTDLRSFQVEDVQQEAKEEGSRLSSFLFCMGPQSLFDLPVAVIGERWDL